MNHIKIWLVGSVSTFLAVNAGNAADLAAAGAKPVEYVRVCSAFGSGFFYIPGTDTCLRLSGRARYEAGVVGADTSHNSDLAQYRGLLRINVDARTQTDYGTLRAFVRLEAASRTGNYLASGTQARIGNGFFATGQDSAGRVMNYISTDKAFIQFAGLTAGRASSFFDFYAHDFELIGGSIGSDVPSTNLLAYTQKLGNGFSTTLSMEDPVFRKNTIYASNGGGTSAAQAALILGTNAIGNATAVSFVDVVERSRMPDFVGALRYDGAWGSAQLSAAVKDVNTGGPIANSAVTNGAFGLSPSGAATLLAARGIDGGAQTGYGWAVQGGIKVNMPFVATGDAFYLQGAYGEGANLYTGYSNYTGNFIQSVAPVQNGPFAAYLSDAMLNPLTGKLELSKSFTVVASYLHYWSPQWRSAVFASYGQLAFGKGARAAESFINGLGGASTPPSLLSNPSGYALSPVLRDSNQIVAGASLIWSPVRDLDIGAEGLYIRTALASGRTPDVTKPVSVNGVPVYTVNSQEHYHIRARVQRDF